MISIIFALSGGPPAAALITSAASRKYCGPSAAGVITHSTFTSWLPLLSNHYWRTDESRRAECRVPAPARRQSFFRQPSRSTLPRHPRDTIDRLLVVVAHSSPSLA